MTQIFVIYVKLKRRQFIIYYGNVLLYKILSAISLISVIIFGVDLHPNCKNLFSIFLVLKAYIYSFQGLLGDIKTHITTLKYIATKNGRLGYFNKEWGTWLFICRL